MSVNKLYFKEVIVEFYRIMSHYFVKVFKRTVNRLVAWERWPEYRMDDDIFVCRFVPVGFGMFFVAHDPPVLSSYGHIIQDIMLSIGPGIRNRSAAARLLMLYVRIPPGAWISIVSVACCLVEVSAWNWSLVQGSPTDCGASLRVI